MTTLEYARYYTSKGFSVIPLKSKSKIPAIESWKEYQTRKPTNEELTKWFGNSSTFNIGIVTGKKSNIVAVDLDNNEAIEFAKKNNFPESPLSKTGKGYHIIYRYKDGVRNFQKRDDLPGIDLRGDGGYIVVEPSIHESGHQYKWVNGKSFDDLPLAELPEIVIAKPENKTPLKKLYKGVESGLRNDSLTRLVGSWVNDGLTFKECLENALLWNSKNNPPLDSKEIERTVRSIFETHHRSKSPHKEPEIKERQLKVISIADLLSMEIPPKENILNPFLTSQSLTMIYGVRGVGKTHVGIGIGIAISGGGIFS